MGSAQQFSVRVKSRHGVARFALRGELDIATVPVLENHLSQFEGDGVVAIIVDLRELTFLDVSGWHAFLAASDRANSNGHRVIFVGASQAARRLFELTNTQFLLDEGEAVNVLGQFTSRRLDPSAQVIAPIGVADV